MTQKPFFTNNIFMFTVINMSSNIENDFDYYYYTIRHTPYGTAFTPYGIYTIGTARIITPYGIQVFHFQCSITEAMLSSSQWVYSRLGASCQQLWEDEKFLDCTVACPHGKIKAHKIVLSAASNYLLNILHENESDHPMLILDTSLDCLKHLMRFIYYGVLPDEENTEFLELAAKLKLHKSPDGSGPVGDVTPPAPRRRPGRPRKTPQVVRREDGCTAELGTDATTGRRRAPPYTVRELNVNVVQTLAGSLEIIRHPQAHPADGLADVSGVGGDPFSRDRSELVARAGIPDQLFGTSRGENEALKLEPGLELEPEATDIGGGDEQQLEQSELEPEEDAGSDWDEQEQGQEGQRQEMETDETAAPAAETPPEETGHRQRGGGGGGGERPARATSSSVQCGYCGKMCCNKETLKVHRRIHTDERPYSCPVAGCSAAFRQRGHLRRHAQLHNVDAPPAKWDCATCKRVFRHEATLERHREQYVRQGRACSPVKTAARPGHWFACDICAKKFNSRGAFDDHVRVHTNQRPFVCSVCEKGFKQKSHLTEHERIHTGQKPFQCTVCSLTFYNRSRYKMHQVHHVNEALLMGEDPSKADPKNKFPACPICFKRFINASNLRLHQQSHSSEKPHQCRICNSRFKLARTLTKHMEAHVQNAWVAAQQSPTQRDAAETGGEAGQQEVAEGEAAPMAESGEGVIILRQEEDGSLTYVPTLQEGGADSRVMQVMLSEPAPSSEDPRLMEDSGDISPSKWQHMSAASSSARQQLLPAEGEGGHEPDDAHLLHSADVDPGAG